MARSLIGLASIPLCITKKPKNLLEHIPNPHFRGLSLIHVVCAQQLKGFLRVFCVIGVFFGFDKHIVM